MSVRLRFAPSPTGKVHIGNIRTAIFNWLYARHVGGEFILRVEDTDRERSTQEAIDALLECMDWLGLDHDGKILYQASRTDEHLAAARKMIDDGNAYYAPVENNAPAPLLFRIPLNAAAIPAVREVGPAEYELHPETPLLVGPAGLEFAQISRKGAPAPVAACLAGFKELKAWNAAGSCLFELDDAKTEAILKRNESFRVDDCVRITFVRREVFYRDMIKGELSKPLDGMKDLVIVRSDSTPVFHLANVCDDVFQKITHIVRGDDHVENTYRHIFLFHALGYPIPQYAHMPMIVNQQGKPYSKRDGDAFVGDFRDKGYLPAALFNYLSLLGWSPGDDREKMTRTEMIEAFTLERVKSAPAQFDLLKLQNMNSAYIAEMTPEAFREWVTGFVARFDLPYDTASPLFATVAAMMQSRTRQAENIADWSYFFQDEFNYDDKAVRKQLKKDELRQGLQQLKTWLSSHRPVTADDFRNALRETEKVAGLEEGKLNQPARLAVSGVSSGADIVETLAIVGSDRTVVRIDRLLKYYDRELSTLEN